MRELEEVKAVLSRHRDVLRDRFHVKEIAVFGSLVRDERRKTSDVDLLVGFEEPPSLFEFMDLEEYLSQLLGMEVDLVTRDALKPRIGERILKEAVFI
ncbi:MAG: nucleotidyltransferase family protein [Nitrososphaerota archaeon]|nr:nucleotidyltransferase family protein [Candidatus Caldarchaeum sp.]MDW8077229.1 nucleotidyltransferase family protein [Nitrososphaerota archaeon]